VIFAVVVYIASHSRLRVARQRLLRLRADRDFVLWGCGLRCRFGWLRCLLHLGLRVDGLNRLNGNAHGFHLSRITSTPKEVT
jgi:hypothetical protein